MTAGMVRFRLTRKWLESVGACSDAVEPFLLAYPDGADLTRDLLDHETVRSHIVWLIDNLPITASARATYEAEIAPAWATFDAATASARATFDAATASALWDAIVASGLAEAEAIP